MRGGLDRKVQRKSVIFEAFLLADVFVHFPHLYIDFEVQIFMRFYWMMHLYILQICTSIFKVQIFIVYFSV